MIEVLLGDTELFVDFTSQCCSHSCGLGGKGGSGANQDMPLPHGLPLNAAFLMEVKLCMKYMSKTFIPVVIKDITVFHKMKHAPCPDQIQRCNLSTIFF